MSCTTNNLSITCGNLGKLFFRNELDRVRFHAMTEFHTEGYPWDITYFLTILIQFCVSEDIKNLLILLSSLGVLSATDKV